MPGLHKKTLIPIVCLMSILIGFTGTLSFAQPTGISPADNPGSSQDSITKYSKAVVTSIANAVSGTVYNSKTPERTLTLPEAIAIAQESNPNVLLVNQDVYLAEKDHDKAYYYYDKITDADDAASSAEQLLPTLKNQLSTLNPADPTQKPTYDYIQSKINYIEQGLKDAAPYRLDTYSNGKVAYLYEKQAKIKVDVTRVGAKVAKQKIALLVSKQYYDVIKYQKLLEVKETAFKRAEEQARVAKASYESGFRAKDDYLLAKAQVELMKADREKSRLDLASAEAELKATVGIDQSTEIRLTDYQEGILRPDLTKAVGQGMTKRLEIQKAEGELESAKLAFQVAESYLGPGAAEYEQAKLNVRKAEIELDRQKELVQKEIYQAYQSLITAQSMAECVKTTVDSATESVSIAEYRYREGFSIPSPVMKALNAEDLAGTIVEVIATQEKLIDVAEKVIEINYSYNLAKANYLYSIGEGL